MSTIKAPAARTGRQYLAAREGLGVSRLAVAREMGLPAPTLQRWEQRDVPLDETTSARWHAALCRASIRRMNGLRRVGLRPADLPRVGLATLLRAYSSASDGYESGYDGQDGGDAA